MTIYPTRIAATRAWLEAAEKAGTAVVLGGGWWIAHYQLQNGTLAKKRLQGLHNLSLWLEDRGILRPLPDGTVEVSAPTPIDSTVIRLKNY